MGTATLARRLGWGGALLATITHGVADTAYFLPDLALAFWRGVVALIALDSRAGGVSR